VQEESFLASLKDGDVEKLPSARDFIACVSLRYQEKRDTSCQEM
jgi:hypothetical protein